MKKILLILIFACAVLSACGNKNESADTELDNQNTNKEVETLCPMYYELEEYGCNVSYGITKEIDGDYRSITTISTADDENVAANSYKYLRSIVDKNGSFAYNIFVMCGDLSVMYSWNGKTEIVSGINKDGTTVLDVPDWITNSSKDEELLKALENTKEQYLEYLKGEMDGQNN